METALYYLAAICAASYGFYFFRKKVYEKKVIAAHNKLRIHVNEKVFFVRGTYHSVSVGRGSDWDTFLFSTDEFSEREAILEAKKKYEIGAYTV